jgi:hypothetical protein
MLLRSPTFTHAGHKPPANVPPSDEIEVLDPNADSRGRPTVELRQECGKFQVDVPPTVLVHKYYYTGDRSFQAQLLPGGPTIIVVNHPKTGERCYIETQMLPGAPRVTYTAHGIEYDYGVHGMTLSFGWLGKPKVTYRNGTKLTKKVANAVHAEAWSGKMQKVSDGSKHVAKVSGDSLKAAMIDGVDVAKTATLPVQNLVRVMPLGTAILDPDKARLWQEKVAQHRRETEQAHAAKMKELDEDTYRTNR